MSSTVQTRIAKKEVSGSKSSRKWYTINVATLPVKLCYLVLLAKQGLFRPYLVLFLINTGLTAGQAGLINGVSQIGFMIGSPVWGYIADRYQSHKNVISILHLFSILLTCVQPYVSVLVTDQPINKCPVMLGETFLKSENIEFQNSSQSVLLFWLLMGLNIAASFFDGALLSFADAGCMQRLTANGLEQTYSRQRFTGAVGFSLGALLGSVLVKYFPISSVNCYTGAFAGYFILTVSLWFSMSWVYYGVSFKLQKTFKRSESQKKKLKQTLKRFHVIFFLMTVFVFGTTNAFYLYFTLTFLKEINSPTLLNGVSLATASTFGMLMYLFTPDIKRLLRGSWGVFLVCFISIVIRFSATSFLYNPWYFPLIEVTGAVWCLFVATAVEHVREISHMAIVTTMYGIMNACLYAIAALFSSIVGGYIYEIFGGRILYRTSAIFTAVWTLFILAFICVQKRTSSVDARDNPSADKKHGGDITCISK